MTYAAPILVSPTQRAAQFRAEFAKLTPTYSIGTKTFEVRETKGKFFYFSRLACRWLPVARAKVVFS